MRPFPVRPIHMAYGLLGVFFVTEPLLWQGKEASSRQAGPADRGSTRLIGATFGFALVALLLAPVLNRWKVGRFRSQRVAWGGVTAMLAEAFPKEYPGYANQTWRLIPFLY